MKQTKAMIRSVNQLRFHFPPKSLQALLLTWYQNNKQSYPWRSRWEQLQDPYHVWVSEIMLQQTLISVVIPKYDTFLEKYPSIFELASAPEDELKRTIQGLGYYRRFKYLRLAAVELVKKQKATSTPLFPTTFLDWKSLPGIGDYTGAAIASIAYGEPVPVVDGNVERVMCRLFNLQVPTGSASLKKLLFSELKAVICHKNPGDFNQAVMELGQQVCKKSQPLCGTCPVKKICLARKLNTQTKAPAPKPPRTYFDVNLRLVLAEKEGHFALTVRPDTAKFLKGILGLPTYIDYPEGKTQLDGDAISRFPKTTKQVGTIKHMITNNRITAKVLVVAHAKLKLSGPIDWVPRHRVDKMLISNLDRKAWRAFNRAET